MTNVDDVVEDLRNMFQRLKMPILIAYPNVNGNDYSVQSRYYGDSQDLTAMIAGTMLLLASEIENHMKIDSENAMKMAFDAVKDCCGQGTVSSEPPEKP